MRFISFRSFQKTLLACLYTQQSQSTHRMTLIVSTDSFTKPSEHLTCKIHRQQVLPAIRGDIRHPVRQSASSSICREIQ